MGKEEFMSIIKETCAKCRGCCDSVKIPVRKESEAGKLILSKWEDKENWPKEHELIDNTEQREGYWIYESNNEPCMFLEDETYACTINDYKPLMCKLYPLKWANQHQYYIDTCSLAFVIPLKEIYSWKNGHEEEITKLIYYVDKAKISRYNRHNILDDLIPISRIMYEREKCKGCFR